MTSIVGTAGSDLILSPNATAIVDASSNATWTPGADNDTRAGEPSPLLSFSPDGNEIAFTVGGSGLIPGVDTGPYSTQVFVKNLSTGAISLVSSDASGAPINLVYGASSPLFAANGTGVYFHNNVDGQLYEKDLSTGALTLESATQGGVAGSANSFAVGATSTELIFTSASDNLVPGVSSAAWRLYVKDLATGAVSLVPNSTTDGSHISISADGSKAAFIGAGGQVYVVAVGTGVVSQVSTNASGVAANSFCSFAEISPDGRKIVFVSGATNLLPGANNSADLFVKDLTTGAVTLVNTDAAGRPVFGGTLDPSFSADGSKVVFTSYAGLVPGDSNGDIDVFVKDLNTGAVTLVSATAAGQQGVGELWYPQFSPDGNEVAFLGGAPLVPGAPSSGLQVYVKTLTSSYDIDGAGGVNTLSYANIATSVSVSLALQGQAQNTGGGGVQTLHNFQNLIGSQAADHLTGDPNNNVIQGGAGDDVIDGGGGADVLDGGGGVNTASFASATSGVTVSLALQGQAQNTGAGSDTLANFQNITGSAFNDALEGNSGDNLLDGGGGTNTVSYARATSGVTVSLALQGQAQDTVGAGRDTLSNFQNLVGSSYADVLTPSTGASSLTGGGGGDTFKIVSGSANTTITDFSHAEGDKIDLSALSQFTSLTDVLAASVQDGANTVIHTGSGSLILEHVTRTNLTSGDFWLASPPVTHLGGLAYPYNAVCYITDVINGDYFRGSGVIVGPHTILTAAHMVWDQDSGQAATEVQISPGLNYNYRVTIPAAAIHYIQVNDAGGILHKVDAQGDFAIIDVAQNLTPYGWFNIKPDFSGAIGSGQISGYPGSNGTTQRDGSGFLTADTAFNVIDYSSGIFGISAGSSGGPIWINEGTYLNPQPAVLGVVSTGSFGVKITASDLAQIQAWVAQDIGLFSDAAGNMAGSIFDDHLIGDANNNVLDGKGADDILTGGGGSDIFVFKPGYGADTITDFAPGGGDRIDLSAFSDLYYLQYVLADAQQFGPNTVIPLPGGGAITLDNVALSSLTPSDFYLAPSLGDFMGAGRGDLFWQNSVNHLTSVWELNDTSVIRGISLPALTGWQVVDTGNFRGGAYAGDFLLRNTSSGMVDIWQDNYGLMDGHDVAQATLDWQIMGTADFNADGKSDILWRNEQNGYVSVWQMDGTNVSTTYNPGVVGLQWKLVAANDFYGDGKAEVLWRDPGTGEVNLWTIDGPGAGQTHGQTVAHLGAEWRVAGTGDFNGDGRADILWFDTVTGQVVLWEMNGPTVTAAQPIGDPGPQWRVVNVADISGDGKADILWRDTGTGQVVAWAMNGFNVDHYGVVATVDNTWKLVAHNYDWA